MLAYLRRVIAQGTEESSKRFALVVATLTFAFCDILCAIAVLLDKPGAPEAAWAFSIPLAGMAGYSYARGVAVEAGMGQGATTLPPTPPDAAQASSQRG